MNAFVTDEEMYKIYNKIITQKTLKNNKPCETYHLNKLDNRKRPRKSNETKLYTDHTVITFKVIIEQGPL